VRVVGGHQLYVGPFKSRRGRFLCLEVDREGGSERVVSCGG